MGVRRGTGVAAGREAQAVAAATVRTAMDRAATLRVMHSPLLFTIIACPRHKWGAGPTAGPPWTRPALELRPLAKPATWATIGMYILFISLLKPSAPTRGWFKKVVTPTAKLSPWGAGYRGSRGALSWLKPGWPWHKPVEVDYQVPLA